MKNVVLKISNLKGLHARASAKFVKCVERYDVDVEVTKDNQTVNGTSIMGLMMLAASNGCSIRVTATGPEADAAIHSLTQLVDDKFGEGE